MTRIVHASDWHGKRQMLPWADVYVFTGDMYPNFPDLKYRSFEGNERWVGYGPGSLDWEQPLRLSIDGEQYVFDGSRRIDPEKEAVCQTMWARDNQISPFLVNSSAPVVLVRGNHDFAPLSILFRNSQEVYEVDHPSESFDIEGLRFGGTRGIPYIVGEWSDELHEGEMSDLVDALPLDLDVLVTHSPPRGMLDQHGMIQIGCGHLKRYVHGRMYSDKMLKAHLFGHCHSPSRCSAGGTLFSNAATAYNVLDLE